MSLFVVPFCGSGSLFGGLGEIFGRSFHDISTLSWKKGYPRFLTTVQCFCMVLGVRASPKGEKYEEEGLRKLAVCHY